jgi:hypothetical protein
VNQKKRENQKRKYQQKQKKTPVQKKEKKDNPVFKKKVNIKNSTIR